MQIGTCQLCRQYLPLCNSHALPNSLFNYILRENSGKGIGIAGDTTTPVQYTADTWDAELLCKDCEGRLNDQYDKYAMSVFRGHEVETRKDSDGVSFFKLDRRRLRMFFLSVLWRISVSTHPSYANVDLPLGWEEEVRVVLLNDGFLPQSRYPVAVFKMRDSTQGGFRNESLRSFVLSPFVRNHGPFISICYPFLSYFIETYLPKLPAKFAKRHGVLHGSSPVFLAPYIEMLEIPEIMDILVTALDKHDNGLSKISSR